MPRTDESPTYNLRAVVRETGVRPDTLRAWERRYGLPKPHRSPGGHRLYSKRDISVIKWLRARQIEGLRISKAVDLWRSLEAQGEDPLQLEEFRPAEWTTPPSSLAGGALLEDLRRDWVDACLAFDEPRSEVVLAHAFSLYPPEVVCSQVLQSGLAQIGEGWHRGEVSVQQEHFASSLATRRLETLISALPPHTQAARVLIGCPPYEEHTFATLLLVFLIRRRGWDVIYLGANVPLERFRNTTQATRPSLVVMAAQTLYTAASLLDVAQTLQDGSLPLAYGGLIFNQIPDLQNRIPGHFLGTSLQEAPQAVERFLRTPSQAPSFEGPSDDQAGILEDYQEARAEIESVVWKLLGSDLVPRPALARANISMARNLSAALKLGDVGYLDESLEWLQAQMPNHRWKQEQLTGYLAAYVEACKSYLTGRGRVIARRLEELLMLRQKNEMGDAAACLGAGHN